jgi:hypothetical protein
MSVENCDLRAKLQALWLLKTKRSGLEQHMQDVKSQLVQTCREICQISNDVGLFVDSQGWDGDLLVVNERLLAQIDVDDDGYFVRFFHVRQIHPSDGVLLGDGSSSISEPEQMPSGVPSQ